MNFTLRRLIAGGLSSLSVLWATYPGVASAYSHVRPVTEMSSVALSVAGGDIRIDRGGSRTFNASSEIQKIEVQDPGIAEVSAKGREMTINGLKDGCTTATVWYAASARPVQIGICVAGANSEVRTASEVRVDKNVTTAGSPRMIPLTSAASAAGLDTQTIPTLSLESSPPAIATIGKMVEHHILVKNIGPMAAEQVEIRGTVSIDSELMETEPKAEIVNSTMVWRVARIAVGGEQRITIRVKPLVVGELSCQTNVSFRTTASTKTPAREPRLKLLCEAPGSVSVGAEVRLVMHISNVGSAPAENVRIRQVIPGIMLTAGRSGAKPLVLEVGTLQPGESRILETTSIARESGLVRINMIAQTEDGTQTTAEHVMRVIAARLSLTTSGPEYRNVEQRGTYQFTVGNSSDVTATNVNLMVGLPEGLEFQDASGDAIFNPEKRTIAWAIGSLDPQQRREFTITVLPTSEGQHLQRAVAWADGNLIAKADKATRVEGLASLVMEVTDVDDPIELGGNTVYQIHIMNRGTKPAERIQIYAAVPDGMIPQRVESSGRYRVQGQQIQFEAIPSLAPQSSMTIQIHVRGVMKGTQQFRAVMTSPDLTNAVMAEESTEILPN
jgi:uncharacterized repeat protein (TIGR01451 family)